MRATRLNTSFFAQTITYQRGEDVSEIDAHVRHRIEIEEQPDGTSKVWDTIDVEIDDTDIPLPPNFGDRILIGDDNTAYLYAYAGHHRLTSYKAAFRRQRVVAQGVMGEQ
jgi:hypothetical protein